MDNGPQASRYVGLGVYSVTARKACRIRRALVGAGGGLASRPVLTQSGHAYIPWTYDPV